MSYSTAHHFDPTALLMIKGEVEQSINAVESTVNALVEEQSLPFAIDDALHQIEQCGRVLDLIDLPNIGKIAQYCAELMRQIIQNPENLKMREVEALSEGTSILKRYMEFATLNEVDAPILLLDSLNRLELALNKPLTTEATESLAHVQQLPVFNLPTVASVEKSDYVHQLYKVSLSAFLAQRVSATDIQAMKIAGQYLAYFAQGTASEQYWGLVNLALEQLAENYLTDVRLRTLIAIERNIATFLENPNFTATEQDMFAVLTMSLGQEGEVNQALRQQLGVVETVISTDELRTLAGKLYAPNSRTIHDVSNLLREEINHIRREIEYNYSSLSPEQISEVQQRMFAVVRVLQVLNLHDVAEKFNQQAEKVVPNNHVELQSDLFAQALMDSVLTVTNGLGLLERQYTSNRLQVGVFNTEIVLDQVDKAHETLLAESKLDITHTIQKMNDYVEQPSNEILVEIIEKLRELSGACLFLSQESGQQALLNGAKFLELAIETEQQVSTQQVNALLEVLAAVDLFIDNSLNKQPVLQRTFDYALESSKRLMA